MGRICPACGQAFSETCAACRRDLFNPVYTVHPMYPHEFRWATPESVSLTCWRCRKNFPTVSLDMFIEECMVLRTVLEAGQPTR